MDNMTAKVSCFARAYHYKNNDIHIFVDDMAAALLGDDYEKIAESMSQGISFFLPDFHGSKEEGLRLIVDRQLSPSVLGRSAFCEEMLHKAMGEGCVQYLIFAAGYDTFGIRKMDQILTVFELDLPELLKDKAARIERTGLNNHSILVPSDLSVDTWTENLKEKGFDAGRRSFCSLLGISYYLDKEEFRKLVTAIAGNIPEESEICLDFQSDEASKETRVNQELASAASEQMKAIYSLREISELLESAGFNVKAELSSDEMTAKYFNDYNNANPEHRMVAPVGVRYLLASRSRLINESKV